MSRGVIGRTLFLGLIQALGATASFYFALYSGGWHWGDPLSASSHLYHQAITMTQAAIVFSQVFNGFAVRTDRESVFAIGIFSTSGILSTVGSLSPRLCVCIRSVPVQTDRIFSRAKRGWRR